jgi:pyruvate-formate lyase
MTATVVLGGVTPEGKDAVNDLSYLFLEAEMEVRLSLEDLVIRIHQSNPDTFLMKACQVAKSLRGKLKFLGDDVAIQMHLSNGKPIARARDYVICGCWELNVGGYSWDLINGFYNLALMLDLALNDGVSRITGEQIGPKTGDPRKFESYEQVWAAYKKQVEALLPVALVIANTDKRLYAEYMPYPFTSSLYHGCIEEGLDLMRMGKMPYMTRAIAMVGAPNVGDSLAAIKKTVFGDGKIAMADLINALDKNFKGEDDLLCILQAAPKFGNDDDYVDSLVNQVLSHAADVAGKYRSYEGAKYTVAPAGATGNIYLGSLVGAMPDGRKAGGSLSEGGISPHQGRNVSGPVATMRSVSKLDHVRTSNGAVLNMKISPDAVKDESKMKRFADMVRTYLETGGYLVQFNIVDTGMLRDAQKHPENYRDLLVRVATYSAYFVEISPELQEDIIARMEFEEM